MYIYTCTCTYVCTYTHTCTHKQSHIYVYVYIYTYVHTAHSYILAYIYICMLTFMCVCMHVHEHHAMQTFDVDRLDVVYHPHTTRLGSIQQLMIGSNRPRTLSGFWQLPYTNTREKDGLIPCCGGSLICRLLPSMLATFGIASVRRPCSQSNMFARRIVENENRDADLQQTTSNWLRLIRQAALGSWFSQGDLKKHPFTALTSASTHLVQVMYKLLQKVKSRTKQRGTPEEEGAVPDSWKSLAALRSHQLL